MIDDAKPDSDTNAGADSGSGAAAPQFTPDMSAEDGLRLIAGYCCVAFDAHLTQMMESADPEGPHRARVALRRLRSALDAFEPILDEKVFKRTTRQARRLFRLLGQVRDADVMLETLGTAEASREHQQHADDMRREVRIALRIAEADAFHRHLTHLLAGEDWRRRGARAKRWRQGEITLIARRAIGRTWDDCRLHGRNIARMSDEDRHELRKDLKTLRYQGEFFGPLWPGAAQTLFIERMRGLQDALGMLNDLRLVRPKSDAAGSDRRSRQTSTALDEAEALWHALLKDGPWWGG